MTTPGYAADSCGIVRQVVSAAQTCSLPFLRLVRLGRHAQTSHSASATQIRIPGSLSGRSWRDHHARALPKRLKSARGWGKASRCEVDNQVLSLVVLAVRRPDRLFMNKDNLNFVDDGGLALSFLSPALTDLLDSAACWFWRRLWSMKATHCFDGSQSSLGVVRRAVRRVCMHAGWTTLPFEVQSCGKPLVCSCVIPNG